MRGHRRTWALGRFGVGVIVVGAMFSSLRRAGTGGLPDQLFYQNGHTSLWEPRHVARGVGGYILAVMIGGVLLWCVFGFIG